MSDNIDIFELINNAKKIVEEQRKGLNKEQQKEFDEKLKQSDFYNLEDNLRKELSSLGSKMDSIFNK